MSWSIGVACAAGLLQLALPSEKGWPLAWIVPAALLLPAQRCSIARAAAVLGTGIGALALVLGWWIPWTLVRSFDAEPAGAAVVWLLGAAAHVPAGALLGALSSGLGSSSRAYSPVMGLAWGVMELSWESVWPRFPSWAVLASRQIDTPLAPLAASIGVYGISAVVAMGSASLLQLAHGGRRGACVVCACLLLAGFAFRTTRTQPAHSVADVGAELALIQPGTAMPRAAGSSAYQRDLLASLLDETRALRRRVSFVLWPEGALLEPPGDEPDLLREIAALVDERRFELVFGALRREARERRVAVFALRAEEQPRAVYDKRRLVPFAESWPAWIPLALRAELGRLAPARPPSPGGIRARLPFELSLCWEAAFSAPRGQGTAGTLVNLANDGWYGDTPAAALALVMARWRALERRAWLLRVATTGVSAVVSPDGRIAASLGLGRRGALLAPLVRRSPETAFERAGYTPLCSSLGALLSLRLVLRASRSRSCLR